jgi:hypothetical protein
MFTIIDAKLCYFWTAQNIRYYELKFLMLVEHNIVYIWIYFQFFKL